MRKCLIIIAVVVSVAFTSCRDKQPVLDGLARSRVDALNREAFLNRFRDTDSTIFFSHQALAYIDDSLPLYNDGRLRAWNNLATAYLFKAQHDSVMCYVDSVLAFQEESENKEVEQILAHLLEARLRQRNCDIAGSYKILYDIEHSDALDNGDGMLYSLARSQYYIITTTLNYHLRSRSVYRQAELLIEMEKRRSELRCDFAEDMSFNYALAYGYSSLCNDTLNQAENLKKALTYCYDNLKIMSTGDRFSTYHLADTYQLIAFIIENENILPKSWKKNKKLFDEICTFVNDIYGFDLSSQSDKAFAFLRESTALFWLHDDPYQRLGAVVATGRYCLSKGDTATACSYFSEALIDSTMLGVAPKFEAALYEGLLTAGCASSKEDVAEWTRMEIELLNFIKQNERADFELQNELDKVHHNTQIILYFTTLLAVLALALLITLFLLRRRTKALQRETLQLQQSMRQDVERIANVETCLSVLRHDITPFVSYLQNDKLPDELRREVTGQLIRTFENIKKWTNLSIPSGLQFRCGVVPLNEVFDSVKESINNFRAESVEVLFEPTTLSVQGDHLLLEIMLRNLVNNSIQYTEKGSVKIFAEQEPDNKDFVRVTVKDTGVGMEPEEIENLFRADKKIRPSEGQGGYGTGFGLILCRYIIKKHDDNTIRGCRIWAESRAGEGSSFHFLVQKAPENQ